MRILRILFPPAGDVEVNDWPVRIAVGLIFTLVGLDKFPDSRYSEWVRIFRQIGWGDWFRYAAGIAEIAGGVAVFVPRLAVAGYALLAATMLSAAAIHVFVLRDGGVAFVPVLLCAFLSACGFHRYSELSPANDT